MDDIYTAAKAYLQITWDDPATDTRLQGICDTGKSLIEHYAGGPLDFSGGLAHFLALEYARYAFNGAADDFASKFATELRMLRLIASTEEVDET